MVTVLHDHSVLVRGAAMPGAGPGPAILERTEQDFIGALLEELGGDDGLAAAGAHLAQTRDANGVLKLLQPVHRTFELALIEAACDPAGWPDQPALQPRLDPQRIESAGLVIRRLAVDAQGNTIEGAVEGWRRAGTAFRGWVPFADEREATLDPDPQRRRPAASAGHGEIDRLLQQRGWPAGLVAEPLAEAYSPLFVAPPEVCAATGKTLLYGLIPVTSAEVADVPSTPPAYQPDDLAPLLPRFLKAGGPYDLPRAGQTVDAQDADAPDLAELADLLRLLASGLNLFGTSAGSQPSTAQDLLAELNQIDLSDEPVLFQRIEDFGAELAGAGSLLGIATLGLAQVQQQVQQPAGEFLRQAAAVLVGREAGAPAITMPARWPAIDEPRAGRLLQLIASALRERLQTVAAPREGQFDDAGRLYHVRAFVRVKHAEDCPPETIWSAPSAPFTIAPWYESGNAPPVRIALPDATDRGLLKSLKPNVAFVLPKSLEDLLQRNSPKDFLGGSPSTGSGGLTLDWICSFSIPIITLCAFIVLNIFLSLLDIVFFWMLFVKICIPFPRRK